MSDTNTNGKGKAGDKAKLVIHETKEQAEGAKPAGDGLRLVEVKKDGVSRFAWGRYTAPVLVAVAKADGYTAKVAEPKGGTVTKEKVAAKLAELTDAELAEMGLKRATKGKGK